MVAVSAPRLFAIVQEYGAGIDARIAAWGMAGSVEIVTTEGDTLKLSKPETAVAFFAQSPDVTAHLIWADSVTSYPLNAEPASAMRWCPLARPIPSMPALLPDVPCPDHEPEKQRP